jgi:hypothetical protein
MTKSWQPACCRKNGISDVHVKLAAQDNVVSGKTRLVAEERCGGAGTAERLNQVCFCVTIDRSELLRALDAEVGSPGFAAELAASRPFLLSNTPVFITRETTIALTQVVAAVEEAARLPGYRDAALAWAAPIAATDFGPAGALMGYDFHITPAGPRLIEVNTNAGGAFLNAVVANAQRACCGESQLLATGEPLHPEFGARIGSMFIEEWRRQRGMGRPATIAIVDDAPVDQYLFPEFRLAKALLERQGVAVVIADAAALRLDGGGLTFEGRRIDLVYNRLVDFEIAEPRHAALRAAYASGVVVVTPNPHVHSLFADKRTLTLLSDSERLKNWGLSAAHLGALRAAVPATIVVTRANADSLWHDRRNLFFKPARGHGSKAAYRGDKLTRKVWGEILAGDYVGQAYAEPSMRIVERDGIPTALKVDIRLYTYAGTAILAAARLYQGQTTNMRTPGGGFAPVLELPLASACVI